jgi:hypothetical protein
MAFQDTRLDYLEYLVADTPRRRAVTLVWVTNMISFANLKRARREPKIMRKNGKEWKRITKRWASGRLIDRQKFPDVST